MACTCSSSTIHRSIDLALFNASKATHRTLRLGKAARVHSCISKCSSLSTAGGTGWPDCCGYTDPANCVHGVGTSSLIVAIVDADHGLCRPLSLPSSPLRNLHKRSPRILISTYPLKSFRATSPFINCPTESSHFLLKYVSATGIEVVLALPNRDRGKAVVCIDCVDQTSFSP